MIVVTGGAGFIGSNFIRDWLEVSDEAVVNIDALTYAGNPDNLEDLDPARYRFAKVDIADGLAVAQIFKTYSPRAIVHFAAESHVDRSIAGPGAFVRTNVVGTFELLEAAREYWSSLDASAQGEFRFLHVSTDEVYGSLRPSDPAFDESTPYAPNSPYSATKAASDHLVRAYHHTYGLPVLTTNCSNNYGPRQFPEKLIPLCIMNAIEGRPLPIYGDGSNVRDWLFVGDHCTAIRRVLAEGALGEVYNVGGRNELTNLAVVESICSILDELRPRADGVPYADQITFVTDRPGHDRRYAIDARKIERELGWRPSETFDTGLRRTITWYLANPRWIERVKTSAYREWTTAQYGAVA